MKPMASRKKIFTIEGVKVTADEYLCFQGWDLDACNVDTRGWIYLDPISGKHKINFDANIEYSDEITLS